MIIVSIDNIYDSYILYHARCNHCRLSGDNTFAINDCVPKESAIVLCLLGVCDRACLRELLWLGGETVVRRDKDLQLNS